MPSSSAFLDTERILWRRMIGTNEEIKKKLSVILHDQDPILINCKGRSGRTWLFLSGVSAFPLRTTPLGSSLLAFQSVFSMVRFPLGFLHTILSTLPTFSPRGSVFSTLLSQLYCRFCNVVSLFPALSRGGGIPGSLVFGSRLSADSSRRSSFWRSPVTIGRPPFFSGHPARTRPDAIK